jgi:hypothetical protein
MICGCCKKLMICKTDVKDNICKNCGIIIPKDFGFSQCEKSVNLGTYCINCKICHKGHNLGKVRNLKVFTDSISSSYNKNSYFCDICGKSKKNNNYVLHCFACSFDVCDECEKLYEKNIVNLHKNLLNNIIN